MKNMTKLLGIIAFATAIGFAMAGCEQPTDSTTGKSLTKTLTGITANYTGTSHIYPFTLLDSLKDHLTVTAQYSDSTSATVDAEDYTLSGNLTAGTSTITASYTEGGVTKTDTFTVTVTAATLDSIAVALNQNAATIYTSTPLDNLKQYLTVTATYTFTGSQETHEETLSAHEYTLSGELTASPPIITVNYGSKTGNFTPTVTAVVLASITAQYNNSATAIYTSTPLDNLKQYLTVKAAYNDGSEKTLAANDYSLSGTLTAGTPTVTASYTEGGVTKTATFTPAVTAVVLDSITAAYTGGDVEINSDVDDLKTALTVTAHYNDGSEKPASDYTLSGDVTAIGQKTITASYTDGGVTKTDTFTVTVVCTVHDWQWTPLTPATCTTAGSEIQTCSLCGITGETRTTSIDPDAHDYQQRSTATETEDGEEGMICTHDPSHKQGTTTIAYATGTAGLSFSTFDSATYVVGGGTATGAIHIPAYYRPNASSQYLPVTEIYFKNDTSITSLTFAEGSQLTTIYNAFEGCTSLASITIPAGVTSIDNNAFKGCTSLTSITFAEGSQLTTISSAFSGCTSLASITIPSSVTSIGNNAFNDCTSLTSITIPSSVTSIGNDAFSGCTGLTITIPASVTSIGRQAFANCTSITSITIPEGVTSISYNTFYRCTSITSITIPEGVTSVELQAFYGCTSLTSITIPASVTTIGINAFYDCASLTSVTFAESSQPQTIGNSAFRNCASLTSITIPASVTSIGEYAFFNGVLTSVTFAGTIASGSFSSTNSFPGDLRDKFYAEDSANGTPGTYTRPSGTSTTWTLQP